jgi:hypothetical protein
LAQSEPQAQRNEHWLYDLANAKTVEGWLKDSSTPEKTTDGQDVD